jgi:hypothetical protein
VAEQIGDLARSGIRRSLGQAFSGGRRLAFVRAAEHVSSLFMDWQSAQRQTDRQTTDHGQAELGLYGQP